MKKKEWNEGLNNLAPDIVENYIAQKEKFAKKKKTRAMLVRLSVFAASFIIIISAAIVIIQNMVPVWEKAPYSAEEISKFFDVNRDGSGSTSSYTKIEVPNSELLYIDEIPDEDYIGIYQYEVIANKYNQKEFKNFIDSILPELSTSIGINVPVYEIKDSITDISSYFDNLYAYCDFGEYRAILEQYLTHYRFYIYNNSEYDNKLILDGETICTDQRLSNEEIISTIESVKNKVFDIFDTSFSDIKIIRDYDKDFKHDAGHLYIYFYNKNEHKLNSMQDIPVSEYIRLEFVDFYNFSGDVENNSIVQLSAITYYKPRNDIKKIYHHSANAKKISLQEAEELLYKGYVFGGHSCPLCMAEQEKVSFEGYDFVDMEYIFEYDNKTAMPRTAIPFYAFYKKIGTAKNGNEIYAKTYVAAIEIEGYEEYFENQKNKHSQIG